MNITSSHIIYFLVFIALVSFSLNLYLFLSSRRQEGEDSTNEDFTSIDQIEKYIESQIIETKKFLNDEHPDDIPKLDSRVTALRTAYLNIEKKAYLKGPSTLIYWSLLNEKLIKLLKVFLPQLFGRESQVHELENRVKLLKERIKIMGKNGNFSSQEKAIKTLDDFLSRYKESQRDQNIIDRYMKKMEQSIHNYEEPQYRNFYRQTNEARKYAKSSMETLARLNDKLKNQVDNVQALENEVSRLKDVSDEDPINEEAQKYYQMVKSELEVAKKENIELSGYINKLKKKIIQYEKDITEREHKYVLSIQEGTSQSKSDELANEVRDLSTEIASSTDLEIGRLRNLLNRQRTSITSLDQTIDELREKLVFAEGESSKKDSIIKQLKFSLKESEMCIDTLEQQVSELTETSSRPSDGIVSEDTFNELNVELEKIKRELAQVLDQKEMNDDLIEYFNEAVKAESMEDLASLLYQQLVDYSCEPTMEFHYAGKSIVASKTGKIGRKDKLLIENLQINECDVGAEGRSVKFRMLNMYGILRQTDSKEKFREYQKRIIATIKVTDKLVEKVSATQLFKGHKKHIDDCQNKLKKAAFELDKGLEIHANRTKSVVSSSVGQLQDIARSAGLENQKVDAFQSIEEEAIKELQSDESLRLKTRKTFLMLIHELDNL